MELDFQMCQLYTLIAQPALALSAMKAAPGNAAELGGGPVDRMVIILTHLSTWGRPHMDHFSRLHLTRCSTIVQQFLNKLTTSVFSMFFLFFYSLKFIKSVRK